MEIVTNDTELLLELKQGVVSAFDKVYHLYFKPLCFFAEKILGDHAVAEDIATDSFVKLLQKNPDFGSMQQLRSYLYTSVRNASIDYLRAEKRHQKSHEEIKMRHEVSEEAIETALISAEVLQSIYLAINHLPDKYQNVLKLALIEGLSNEEIVIQTGMAYQTVRNHKSEGIKLLRLRLFDEGSITPLLLIHILSYISHRSF